MREVVYILYESSELLLWTDFDVAWTVWDFVRHVRTWTRRSGRGHQARSFDDLRIRELIS